MALLLKEKLYSLYSHKTEYYDIQPCETQEYYGRNFSHTAQSYVSVKGTRSDLGYRVRYFEPKTFMISIKTFKDIENNLKTKIKEVRETLNENLKFYWERGYKTHEIHGLENDENYIQILNELISQLNYYKKNVGMILDYNEAWLYLFNEGISNFLLITDENGKLYTNFVCFGTKDKFKIVN